METITKSQDLGRFGKAFSTILGIACSIFGIYIIIKSIHLFSDKDTILFGVGGVIASVMVFLLGLAYLVNALTGSFAATNLYTDVVKAAPLPRFKIGG